MKKSGAEPVYERLLVGSASAIFYRREGLSFLWPRYPMRMKRAYQRYAIDDAPVDCKRLS
jgi:hypothetical protein